MFFALMMLLAEGEGKDTTSPLGGLIPLVLIILAFYFLVLMPARRREKQQREMLNNTLKKNDEVVTSAGIFGVVANIKDEEVTLKVDESSNVRIRVLKSSIAKILTPRDPNKEVAGETKADK